MIKYHLDVKKLILRLEPNDKLDASDFEKLSKEIDPIIKAHKHLHGVLIVALHFPGWKNFEGLFGHLRFIKNHHENVDKLAMVTKDMLIKLGVSQIETHHFIHPEVQIFDTEKEALSWLSA